MNAPYTRSFSFAGFQANQPAKPLPGQRVDIELENIAREFAAVWASIAAGGGGGTTPGVSGELLALPPRSLRANLLGTISLPQVVSFDQFRSELGVGSGGGELPDWNDVQNKPVFGSAALRNVGAAAGTVAAGDDPRIVGALQAANNGSDFANKAVTRSNLGLGAAALLAVGVAGGVASYDDPRFSALINDVRFYGAKVDGTTDDTAAWNAMEQAQGRVVVPPGVSVLNGRVGSLTKSQGVVYQGAGTARTTVLLGPNAGLNVSGRNWAVDGFKFKANGVVACALRTGTVDNNRGWRITNNEWSTDSVNGDGTSNYFQIGLEMNSCWFGRAVNNEFINWGVSFQRFYGTAVTWSSSVNNYFAFNSIVNWGDGYVWELRQAATGVNNEGHQIVGNVFVANKRNAWLRDGIYAVFSANCIDLTAPNGPVIESYIVNLVLHGNWFANTGDSNGGIAIFGGEAPIISGNTFRFNGNPSSGGATLLVIQNCNQGIVTNNQFFSGTSGMSSNGNTDGWFVSGNQFIAQGGVACNLSLCTNLIYAVNKAQKQEILPQNYDNGRGQASSGTRNPFVASAVYTTPSANAVQEVTFNIPAGVFADRPASVAITMGGDPGFSFYTYYAFDRSSATSVIVGIRRTDGAIPAGNALRIGIVA